ncbi:hypothetical protein TIFTF001_013537 [Ficus carica]|uniref:Uncharacterized protein n=1 Tax=Ficus carica TaxID=3494 RepID=A0AA88AI13_FICCA|nr:hypothetical protein TIFTF001_013537 [Ficus carica]
MTKGINIVIVTPYSWKSFLRSAFDIAHSLLLFYFLAGFFKFLTSVASTSLDRFVPNFLSTEVEAKKKKRLRRRGVANEQQYCRSQKKLFGE